MARPLSKPESVHRALWDEYVLQLRVKNQQIETDTLKKSGRIGAWRRWHRVASIEAALPLVRRLAREVSRMFARHIDPRDLEQAGAVGLVHAANAYDPALGQFPAYAWFRVRGAIIDSQKRRTYHEEQAISLDGMRDPQDGWLPPELHTDRAPLADEQAHRVLVRQRLVRVIETLPPAERYVTLAFLRGAALRETAAGVGRSPTWAREKLASAREMIRRSVR